MTPRPDPDPAQVWIQTRPPIIQAAAIRWPLGSIAVLYGEVFNVIGWAETTTSDRTHDPADVSLLLSRPADIATSYQQMIDRRVAVCARHFVSEG